MAGGNTRRISSLIYRGPITRNSRRETLAKYADRGSVVLSLSPPDETGAIHNVHDRRANHCETPADSGGLRNTMQYGTRAVGVE